MQIIDLMPFHHVPLYVALALALLWVLKEYRKARRDLKREQERGRDQRIEDQYAIAAWAEEAFGPVASNARLAARANEEMSELLRCLTTDDDGPGAGEEVADILIVLSRLGRNMGFNIDDEVDKKMAINRSRTWDRTGTGHGYHHVDDGPLSDTIIEDVTDPDADPWSLGSKDAE